MTITMFEKGIKYKLNLANGMFWTGNVLEENERSIKFLTIKGETLILSKTHIVQAEVKD